MVPSEGYKMLAVCQALSPTGKEQAAFARLYNDTKADGLTDVDTVKYLARALLDGLDAGNWPKEERK